MSQVASPAPFEHVAFPVSHNATRQGRSCCQQAVDDAMENTASMGAIASLAVLLVGFSVGMTTAWLLFG